MSLPLKLSYIELQNAKDLESIDIELDSVKYSLAQNQEKSDTLKKVFDKPLTLETEPLSLSFSRKKPLFSCCGQTVPETVTLRPDEVSSKLNGEEFQHVWGKVSIKLGFLPQAQPGVMDPSTDTPLPEKLEDPQAITEQSIVTHSILTHDLVLSAGTTVPANTLVPADALVPANALAPVNLLAPANALVPADTLAPANTPGPGDREGLQPTTQSLIEQCPRFRVLVVGKSGVGKSSLINRIFGVENASVANEKPGEADIEQEFTSPENDRLILHDSKGFEPADGSNYDIVKSFIQKRKNMPEVKDQLHAVWLCFQIPIPTYGERLLEDGAETFLKIRKEVLGNTPTIVVFTKHDRLVTFMRQKRRGDPEAGQQYLQEFCIQPIQDFTGDKGIAHVAVSSKPKHEEGLEQLISLTQEKVSDSFTSPGNGVSPVPLAAAGAQRILPTLKVDLSIDVGKQRYWRALGASANFRGYTIQDCLGVIHTDIVTVWNFYDPCEYLNSGEFRKMMMHMVERVDAPAGSTHEPSRSDSLDGGGVPLVVLAPIMLPLKAFAALGGWAFETYQRLQGVPTKFMAYIVDLTHVLEILFSLTAGMRAKKLTRRAIKLAYKAYDGSEWMRLTHTDIKAFQCWSTARDEVLHKITSMISSDGREVRVSRTIEGIRGEIRADLEKDEEWVVQAISQ
ncbi:hypothetical protein EDD16DRAFT_1893777 [Pisolithus croceorrhizus]|nr:hypothetical protein EV401DRAFT_407691 [Pisolithus croceorrhizus]KAI6124152.1 hypothetical protein EDD16DRAFT_1893777 [Pisolithus croceorrhizus]KAI6159937.1 hypothetical protein EDD17DRAFT_1876275 [Pisolithus thermaeus]